MAGKPSWKTNEATWSSAGYRGASKRHPRVLNVAIAVLLALTMVPLAAWGADAGAAGTDTSDVPPSVVEAGRTDAGTPDGETPADAPEGTGPTQTEGSQGEEPSTPAPAPAGDPTPYATDLVAPTDCGECTWRITAEGELRISPKNGTSGKLNDWTNDFIEATLIKGPWCVNDADKITSVVVDPGVQAVTCNSMFYNLSNVTSIDVSNLNTSGVTDMYRMFSGCTKAETIVGLTSSTFDTSSVTNMASMFTTLSKIRTLDVSRFNTANVTTMNLMFANLKAYEGRLDLSSFDTRSVTDMYQMFMASTMGSIDLSSFDTRKVTTMGGMFRSCPNLTSLDLSNFQTPEVTNMAQMFQTCSRLVSLDLSNMDTSKCTTSNKTSNMFKKGFYADGVVPLAKLTLGPKFAVSANPGLDDFSAFLEGTKWPNAKWTPVGVGTVTSPVGPQQPSAADVFTYHSSAGGKETYVASHVLTLYGNGGTWNNGGASKTSYVAVDGIPLADGSTTSGCAVPPDSKPAKDGHVLTGWSTSSATDSWWNFSTPLSVGNTELYARYALIKSFSFMKVDAENGGPLAGATFKLFKWAGTGAVSTDLINANSPGANWQEEQAGWTSGANGKVTIEQLADGYTYRLVETAAPSKYVLPTRQWNLAFNSTLTITDVGGSATDPSFSGTDPNYILENARTLKTVSITKVDATKGTPLQGVGFKLYRWTGSGSIPTDTLVDPSSLGGNWSEMAAPTSDASGVFQLTMPVDVAFRLVETSTLEGYEVPGCQWNLTASMMGEVISLVVGGTADDPDITGGIGDYKLANKKSAVPFSFVKADAETNGPLAGATFKLFQWTGSGAAPVPGAVTPIDPANPTTGWTLAGEATSALDGSATFADGLAKGGTYLLVETAAPEGYQLPLGQWHIAVSNTSAAGTSPFTFVGIGKNGGGPPAVAVKSQAGGTFAYTFYNMRSFDLPLAGCVGTDPFNQAGAALLALAAGTGIATFVRRRRRAFR